MLLFSLIAGVAALYLGAEWLVRGASRIAAAWQISPLVIGLTVVAFGTSMPEMVAGAVAAYKGNTDVVLGNVVGSNVANVGLILGLSALFRRIPLQWSLFRRELPFMLLTSVLVYALAATGVIGRVTGALLFLGLVGFTLLALRWAREQRSRARAEERRLREDLGLDVEVRLPVELARVAVGLLLLTGGAHVLVQAAVSLAARLGVSEFLISVTMVAVGTSLPEMATSIVAAVRDEADVLVGNIVGSNIFNLLGALGVAAMIRPLPVAASIVRVDIPVMLGFSLAMTLALFHRRGIVRWEGTALLAAYAAYVLYLVL